MELSTDTANILIRNEDADYMGRIAVELCYTEDGTIEGITEFGLDYEYFDTEEEAHEFIKNTILIPDSK